MKKICGAVLVGTLFAVVAAGPADAQADYPLPVASVTLSNAAINCPSGETLTIAGEGFIPNEPAVRIFFDGQQIAEVFPNGQGSFSVTVDPPGAAAGQHTITAKQFVAPEEPDQIVASATLTCVSAGGAVAFTGRNISLGLVLLVALVVIGAGALVLGRRRARTAA